MDNTHIYFRDMTQPSQQQHTDLSVEPTKGQKFVAKVAESLLKRLPLTNEQAMASAGELVYEVADAGEVLNPDTLTDEEMQHHEYTLLRSMLGALSPEVRAELCNYIMEAGESV